MGRTGSLAAGSSAAEGSTAQPTRRPPASIALDRDHGQPPAAPATVGSGEGTRLRRVLLRWQAQQPCRSGRLATVVQAGTPTLDPTLDPTPATRVPP
jgi:hypothetical protein